MCFLHLETWRLIILWDNRSHMRCVEDCLLALTHETPRVKVNPSSSTLPIYEAIWMCLGSDYMKPSGFRSGFRSDSVCTIYDTFRANSQPQHSRAQSPTVPNQQLCIQWTLPRLIKDLKNGKVQIERYLLLCISADVNKCRLVWCAYIFIAV